MTRQLGLAILIALPCLTLTSVMADEPVPVVTDVESQPLKAQAQRIAKALQFLGSPLSDEETKKLRAATQLSGLEAVKGIQQVLDQRVLAYVHINPESRVKASPGSADRVLDQQGWRVFLVKVHNEAGVTAPLRVQSPNAAPVYRRSTNSAEPKNDISEQNVANRWMSLAAFDKQPLTPRLSSLEVEYRIVQIYSRDVGKREATLTFDVGQGTQDLGFRSEIALLFECQPAVSVQFNIRDIDGKPTTGQFVLRDSQGRVYPARSKRLAPDFFFHDQVYRHDGETIPLPAGEYDVVFTRGPEYLIQRRQIQVPQAKEHSENFALKRWIRLTDYGWYSGDHHVHAAGCAHYEAPTEGVRPEDMMRHILGEDLNVGCVLSWGPCWYYQKEFFQGKTHALSTPSNLMRYDVEVSGFPSSHAGHLCLLRLTEDDYPGTTRIDEWPSWDLPVLQWGKRQNAVVGYSHSGWGLKVDGDKLPTYQMPAFDGIGANEYIVDVVHDACDFISAVDTPIIWELNIWYHTLNCGYETRISGETDFPCIYGERVGLGRAYVKLDKDQELNYDNWVKGIRDGRSYCCDGRSHLIDFAIGDFEMGLPGKNGRASVMSAKKGDSLKVTVKAAAFLEEQPREDIRSRPLEQKPYWHVERSRIKDSRQVAVELIVNGQSVAQTSIPADGSVEDVAFDLKLDKSSWVALRIFPSAHTNPIFVEVDDQPIRASRLSAEWCRAAVDVCWNAKKQRIRDEEKEAARKAYDVARQAFDKIIEVSFDDRVEQ